MALTQVAKNRRKDFRKKYGQQTAEMVRRFARGQSVQTVANALNVPVTSVRTTKGNYTRGTYVPFAYRNPNSHCEVGVCQY